MRGHRQQVPAVPVEALFEIERELGQPLFQGVPIGSTLTDILNIEVLDGHGDFGWRSSIENRLRYGYHWLGGTRAPEPPRRVDEMGRILFTMISDKPRGDGLTLPVVSALGPDQSVILIGSVAAGERVPSGTGRLMWPSIQRAGMGQWRRDYRACAPAWHQTLRAVIRRHSLPERLCARLADALLVASQRVVAFGALLDDLRPSAVVTEYDRNARASCLVLAAKVRGAPTMTMMHGVINPPYGYVPLLADVAFCWGEQHRDQMVALGTEPERLAITGCPAICREVRADPVAARRKIELDDERPLVLFASNPIDPQHRKRLATIFCEAVRRMGRACAMVRLHPSEKLDFYKDEIRAFPQVRFVENGMLTLDEAMAASTLVVCQNSGFGNDALLKGKIVIVADTEPAGPGNGRVLVERAGCPFAQTPDQLASLIESVLRNPGTRSELRQRAEAYLSYFCAACGEEAARRTAEHIQSRRLPPVEETTMD